MTKKIQPYFWLAILAHLLLFLGFSFPLLHEEELAFEKKSDKYVPAYLYQKETNPSQAAKNSQPSMASKSAQSTPAVSPEAIPLKQQQTPLDKIQPDIKKISQSSNHKTTGSSAFIQAESPTVGSPRDEPLLKELSRATATKLFYPPEAAAFKLKGTAVIRFLLYPDGTVTEVTLAQSSGFRLLDNAALSAIKAISPVRDANLYLTKPKVLLAGIIFG